MDNNEQVSKHSKSVALNLPKHLYLAIKLRNSVQFI